MRQVWRNDRFGRGGDHSEFLNAGFPAVRLSEAVENYRHQHQDVRVEQGVEYGDTVDKMDFAYLARVTRLNVAALAALASAPPPPEPAVEGAVSTDTKISWRTNSFPSPSYIVRWRRTDASNWQHEVSTSARNANCVTRIAESSLPTRVLPPESFCSLTLKGVRIDDWVFGVSSVSVDAFDSPVASAVPGGAFGPWVAPKEERK